MAENHLDMMMVEARIEYFTALKATDRGNPRSDKQEREREETRSKHIFNFAEKHEVGLVL
jgi:hypothetical protein